MEKVVQLVNVANISDSALKWIISAFKKNTLDTIDIDCADLGKINTELDKLRMDFFRKLSVLLSRNFPAYNEHLVKINSILEDPSKKENQSALVEEVFIFLYKNKISVDKKLFLFIKKNIEKLIITYLIKKLLNYFSGLVLQFNNLEPTEIKNIVSNLRLSIPQNTGDLRSQEFIRNLFSQFMQIVREKVSDFGKFEPLFKNQKHLVEQSQKLYDSLISEFAVESNLCSATFNVITRINIYNLIKFKIKMDVDTFLKESKKVDIETLNKRCHQYLTHKTIPYAEAGTLFSRWNVSQVPDNNYYDLDLIKNLSIEWNVLKTFVDPRWKYIAIFYSEVNDANKGLEHKRIKILNPKDYSEIVDIRFVFKINTTSEILISFSEKESLSGEVMDFVSIQQRNQIKSFSIQGAMKMAQDFESAWEVAKQQGFPVYKNSFNKHFGPISSFIWNDKNVEIVWYSPDGNLWVRVVNDLSIDVRREVEQEKGVNTLFVHDKKRPTTLETQSYEVSLVFVDELPGLLYNIEKSADYLRLSFALISNVKINKLKFTPDGKILQLILDNGFIKFLDVQGYFTFLEENKDDVTLFVNNLKSWFIDFENWKIINERLKRIYIDMKVPLDKSLKTDYDFSSDSKYSVIWSASWNVDLIDVFTGALVFNAKLHNYTTCVKFIPWSPYFISWGVDWKLKITDISDKSCVYEKDFGTWITTLDVDKKWNIIVWLSGQKIVILEPKEIPTDVEVVFKEDE